MTNVHSQWGSTLTRQPVSSGVTIRRVADLPSKVPGRPARDVASAVSNAADETRPPAVTSRPRSLVRSRPADLGQRHAQSAGAARSTTSEARPGYRTAPRPGFFARRRLGRVFRPAASRCPGGVAARLRQSTSAVKRALHPEAHSSGMSAKWLYTAGQLVGRQVPQNRLFSGEPIVRVADLCTGPRKLNRKIITKGHWPWRRTRRRPPDNERGGEHCKAVSDDGAWAPGSASRVQWCWQSARDATRCTSSSGSSSSSGWHELWASPAATSGRS